MASGGTGIAWCLLVLSLAPWVTVVGYELRGHRHDAEVLAALAAPDRAARPGVPSAAAD